MKMKIAAAALVAAPLAPVHAQMVMPGMNGDDDQHATPEPPTVAASSPATDQPVAGGDMPRMTMTGGDDSGAGSGTSRVPADDPMQALHVAAGGWMLMAHGYAWGSSTHQGGPRGDADAFVASMAMLEASRPLGAGATLQLRAMLSLDPLMGERGYPNLFATGETAHGVPLVDRQHPHDLFMEVSGRLDFAVGGRNSLFVYGGLPGEPALGPSAFMHRGSARFLPEAPITHHWFDSTHISFGVLTAGYATPRWQLEASLFNGREPGEDRWNIETGALDSWSARLSWTPSPRWAAQISYGALAHPERQHPERDEGRLIASLSYAANGLTMTGAWSRKDEKPGPVLAAWLVEAAYDLTPRHAIFGRVENVANDELFEDEPLSPLEGRRFRVTRFTAGYAYTLPLGEVATLALGVDGSLHAASSALDAAYGAAPKSVTLFAKLALGKGD